MLSALAGGPFHDSLTSAFDKLTDALPPALWRFIEKSLATRPWPPRRRRCVNERGPTHGGLADQRAILAHRRGCRMRYHSFRQPTGEGLRRGAVRTHTAYARLYLFAFVPAYGEMRTFAVQRVEDVTVSRRRWRSEGTECRRVSRFAVGVLRHTGARRGGVLAPAEAPYFANSTGTPISNWKKRPAAACG